MYKILSILFIFFTLTSEAQQALVKTDYPPQDTARISWLLSTVLPQHERTQIPHPPYHYTIEDCTFSNAETGVQYGATLTKPLGVNNFPTVVLLSGTGSQDRDYTVAFHKFFWILADYLSNHGIGVLRIDDRSSGSTTGIFNTSTTADFAKDVLAAVNWLNTRKDIDPQRIGLIGHSEGGIVAPMAYAMAPSKISFMALIGAPIVGLHRINAFQSEKAYAKTYQSDSVLTARMRLHQRIMRKIPDQAHNLEGINQATKEALDTLYQQESASTVKAIIPDKNALDRLYRSYQYYLSPWWQYILGYDPTQDIRKIDCPVLAVYGDKDQQVPPVEDDELLKKNLPHHPSSEIILMPNMNHFMQPDTSGNPDQYARISTTIKPELLEKLQHWINSLY